MESESKPLIHTSEKNPIHSRRITSPVEPKKLPQIIDKFREIFRGKYIKNVKLSKIESLIWKILHSVAPYNGIERVSRVRYFLKKKLTLSDNEISKILKDIDDKSVTNVSFAYEKLTDQFCYSGIMHAILGGKFAINLMYKMKSIFPSISVYDPSDALMVNSITRDTCYEICSKISKQYEVLGLFNRSVDRSKHDSMIRTTVSMLEEKLGIKVPIGEMTNYFNKASEIMVKMRPEFKNKTIRRNSLLLVFEAACNMALLKNKSTIDPVSIVKRYVDPKRKKIQRTKKRSYSKLAYILENLEKEFHQEKGYITIDRKFHAANNTDAILTKDKKPHWTDNINDKGERPISRILL